MFETAYQRAQETTSPLVMRLVRTREAFALLLLAGTLWTAGCGKKQARVFIPPPVYASTPPPASPVIVDVTLPSDVDAAIDPGIEPIVATANLPPAPAKPTPPAKPAAAKPAPATVVEVVPPPVVAGPKPTTIFSAEERRKMNQEIDQRLDRVRKALAGVEGKNLSAELKGYADQARNFLMNTEQTRVQDLVTAVSLAQRADFYAMELVQRLP